LARCCWPEARDNERRIAPLRAVLSLVYVVLALGMIVVLVWGEHRAHVKLDGVIQRPSCDSMRTVSQSADLTNPGRFERWDCTLYYRGR
jgi:hypothetical protein